MYETSITLITLTPKAGKATARKESYKPISLTNIDVKILNRALFPPPKMRKGKKAKGKKVAPAPAAV